MIASLKITAFPSLHQQIYGQNFNYGKKISACCRKRIFFSKKEIGKEKENMKMKCSYIVPKKCEAKMVNF